MTQPRTGILAALGTVAALLLLLLGGVGAAAAHDQLLSSNPAAGAVLEEAPTVIRMQFSDDVLNIGGVVVVADAAGMNWADGALTLDGGTVTQPVKAGAPDGAYQIRWRVVSADGHPISDVIDYTVGHQTAAAPPPGHSPAAASAPDSAGPDAGSQSTRKGTAALVIVGWGVAGGAVGVGAYSLIVGILRRRGSAT